MATEKTSARDDKDPGEPIGYKTKFEIAVIENIKAMRKSRKASQQYIGKLLHVDRSRIGQIERPNDASVYRLGQLNVLAKEFGCKPKDFLPDYDIED